MSNNEKKILCGDDLLNCDPNDYKNVPLEMTRQSDTIGIATDDNGAYYVYQKGERNAIDWKKPFDSFDSALEYARDTYKDYLEYPKYLYGKDAQKSTEKGTVIYITPTSEISVITPTCEISVGANYFQDNCIACASTPSYIFEAMLFNEMELFLRCSDMDDSTVKNLMQAARNQEIEAVGIIAVKDGFIIGEAEYCIDWNKYESKVETDGDEFRAYIPEQKDGNMPEAYSIASRFVQYAKLHNLTLSSWIRVTPSVRDNATQYKHICNKLGYTIPSSMLKWNTKTNHNLDICFINHNFIPPQEHIVSNYPNV